MPKEISIRIVALEGCRIDLDLSNQAGLGMTTSCARAVIAINLSSVVLIR
jgi:hypothetical protein